MAKYNMDGISDAYFSSSKQYNDYTKYLNDREEEKQAKQAAINENNKRMSTVSDSHYPHNEKNARMRDVSPAYNFGGSQYKKILGISDPAFSGGDQFAAYGEYLKRISEENKKTANNHSAVEIAVRTKTDDESGSQMPEWLNFVPSTLPKSITKAVQDKISFNSQLIGDRNSAAQTPEWLESMVSTFPGVSNGRVPNSIIPELGIGTMPVPAPDRANFNNTPQSNEVLSYKQQENDVSNTLTVGEFHWAEEKMTLETELQKLIIRAEQIFEGRYITGEFDKESYMKVIGQMNTVRKKLDMLNGRTDPLFSEDFPFANNVTLDKIFALSIAGVYQDIWYNKSKLGNSVLRDKMGPIFSFLSLDNDIISTAAIQISRLLDPKKSKEDAELLDNMERSSVESSGEESGAFEDGFIVDQTKLKYGDKYVGYGFGSSPANGCGWISVYNAMRTLGEDVRPYSIMREVELGALALGTAGTDPLYIKNYFQLKGYDAQIYFTKEDIERNAPKSDACILIYGWYYYDNDNKQDSIGAHFVACEPIKNKQGMMTFYNNGRRIETTFLQAQYSSTDLFRLMICIKKR